MRHWNEWGAGFSLSPVIIPPCSWTSSRRHACLSCVSVRNKPRVERLPLFESYLARDDHTTTRIQIVCHHYLHKGSPDKQHMGKEHRFGLPKLILYYMLQDNNPNVLRTSNENRKKLQYCAKHCKNAIYRMAIPNIHWFVIDSCGLMQCM